MLRGRLLILTSVALLLFCAPVPAESSDVLDLMPEDAVVFAKLDNPDAFCAQLGALIAKASPGFPANTCEDDNCPFTYNPDQADSNGNGVGDVCDIGCCIGTIRGNIDMDPLDEITITDLVYLVNYMFQEGPAPPCTEEANVDGDPAETVDVADLVMLVQFMFQGGDPPANCSGVKD